MYVYVCERYMGERPANFHTHLRAGKVGVRCKCSLRGKGGKFEKIRTDRERERERERELLWNMLRHAQHVRETALLLFELIKSYSKICKRFT